MTDVLIFSKDRACQLDALLRSIEFYAPDLYRRIMILWLGSNEGFLRGYFQLQREHSLFVEWVQQIHSDMFRDVVVEWVNDRRADDRISFLVDDDIFYRPAPDVSKLGDTHVSLRLGLNTTRSQPMGVEQQCRRRLDDRDGILFPWPGAEGDYGYPLSLDGDIYTARYIGHLLDFPFSDPTQLEAGLASQGHRFYPPWTWMPHHSCLVSIPANRVTVSSHNPCSEDPELSAGHLNDRYLAGNRIDFPSMDWLNIGAAHQNVPFVWT